MIVSAIVAASDNGVIGNKGKIPWEMRFRYQNDHGTPPNYGQSHP
jgi:dihydrofolate reductase